MRQSSARTDRTRHRTRRHRDERVGDLAWFVAATETALTELLTAPLDELDLVVLMIEEVHFGDHLCGVAVTIFYGTYSFDAETELRRQGHRPLRSPAA